MEVRTGVSRSRWAAFGAAVAVAVGGGSVAVTHAVVSSGERAVFVPITPCRLFDMRPPPYLVGARSTPLTQGETLTQQVTGSNGNCTIPGDATGVAMNITAADGTAASFLTVWPADAAQPLTSNLNWVAGGAPAPNKVDVKLSSTGTINLFNNAGSVSVVADIVGYYADHNHDDRYYTKTQADTQLGAKANAADVYTKAQINSLPASSIIAGGVIERDGTVFSPFPQFGSTWTVSRSATGRYVIVFPAFNPGCVLQDFPLLMLTSSDLEGTTAVYWQAGTACMSGDTSLEVRTTDPAGVFADVRFQFIAFLPGAAQILPTLASSGASQVQSSVASTYSQCTMNHGGVVTCT